MKKGVRRGLSLFVVMLMLAGVMPTGALAEEMAGSNSVALATDKEDVNNSGSGEPVPYEVTVPAPSTGNQVVVAPPEAISPVAGMDSDQNGPANETIQTSAREGDFEYENIDGGVSMTRYTGSGGDVVIPDTLGGEKVVAIGRYAFRCHSYDKITSIIIPDSVTAIGDWAFEGCSGLTNIIIPDKVITIGNRVFQACSGLTSISVDANNLNYTSISGVLYDKAVTTLIASPQRITSIAIPNSVSTIGEGAFVNCSELTNITMPDGLKTIGEGAFEGCSGLTGIMMPDSVTTIGDFAFSLCKGITSLTIPAGVTTINNRAFQECSGLISVTVQTGLKTIGECAFIGCSGLTGITIPNSVTSIGDGAFGDCSNLTSITIPNSVTSIGDAAFGDCSNLTSITIPDSVTSIGDGAFQFCYALTSITIPDSVTFIDNETFRGSGLTSIVIPNSVTSIGDGVFWDCDSLKSISIPNSITSIGESAFLGCSGLTSIVIPNSVSTIRDWTFYGCSGLTSIEIPNSVTTIGDYAFSDCSGLTTISVDGKNLNYASIGGVLYDKAVTKLIVCPSGLTSIAIPEGVKAIGNTAFQSCTRIASIEIPSSVTAIGDAAFSGCSGLTSIKIPNSVTAIGIYAFSGCSELTNISIPTGVTSISNYEFFNCSGLTSITIPTGVTSIGDAAFAGCGGLTSVMIPTGVTSIGEWAFEECSGLTRITIPESVTTIDYAAFRSCSNLSRIDIPDSVTNIDYGAFYGCDSLSIYGVLGSYAETFANAKKIPFVDINASSFGIKSFNATPEDGQYVNTAIQLVAEGKNGKSPYQYRFSYQLNGGAATVIKNYSTVGKASFTPTKAGVYTLMVDVKDAGGEVASKTINSYAVATNPAVASFTTDKASGQVAGTPIGLSASGSGGMGEYQYKFYAKLGNVTIPVQDYSSTASATFTLAKAGTYTLCVDMKDRGGKVVSKTINGYNVVNPLAVKTFTAGKPSGQAIGSSVTLNGSGSDGKAPYQYKFTWTKDGGAENLIRDYGNSGAVTFKPEQAGTYTLKATIKDGAGNTAEKTMDYVILPDPQVDSFTVDTSNGPGVNCGIGLTAKASGGKAPYQYKFYYKQGGTTTVIQNFGTKDSATFKPAKAGDYTLYVDVKDANGRIATSEAKTLTIYAGPTVTSLTANPTSGTGGQYVGTSIALSATASGGTLDYSYAYYYKLGTGNEVMIRDYDKDSNATFTPAEAGSYTLIVKVKDKNNIVATKSIASYKVVGVPGVKSFIVSPPKSQKANTSITLTAMGTDGKVPYQYQFSYKKAGAESFTTIQSYSSKSSVAFKLKETGSYTLMVEIKDAGGKTVSQTMEGYEIK